ncbi:TetR/AcrR family transcriptional regulator [Zavarzinia sp. CC-PAN008]|uniref:TetR/AcrR family transcriptional regulator n=1 Tax=Zavarzinia sp. CC-PAN008 TaxID=3243332 RepID=UPI003F744D90
MRYAKGHKEQTRARIVGEAARQLRQRGLSGVALAELMRAQGLTHGGFYAHFPSRDALVAEAVGEAMAGSRGTLRERLSAAEGDRLAAFLKSYVSRAHRDTPEAGCAIAALAGEVARGPDELKARLGDGVVNLIALLEGEGASAEERARVIAGLSAAVGALVLSRVTDPALSDEILRTVRDQAARPAAPVPAEG